MKELPAFKYDPVRDCYVIRQPTNRKKHQGAKHRRLRQQFLTLYGEDLTDSEIAERFKGGVRPEAIRRRRVKLGLPANSHAKTGEPPSQHQKSPPEAGSKKNGGSGRGCFLTVPPARFPHTKTKGGEKLNGTG